MKKSFLILGIVAVCSSLLVGQKDKKFRFGVEADPIISFMMTNSKYVEGTGANVGLNIGMFGEYYFSENYAITAGIGYTINKGGGLTYQKGGDLLPAAELSDELLIALSPTRSDRLFKGNTTIKSSMTWVSLPVGFKMRTNELGGTFLRGFAHIPVISFDIPVSATADITYAGKTYEKEKIYKDIFPFAMSVGGGAGVEWYPNDKDLAVFAGIYYMGGLFDLTEDNASTVNGENLQSTRGVVSNITIRLGVMF